MRRPIFVAALLVVVVVVVTAPFAAAKKPKNRNPHPARPGLAMKTNCTQKIGPADAARATEIIEQQPDGAVLCFAAGTYRVNAVLSRPITLCGPAAGEGEAILDGASAGSVLRINESARNVRIERLTLTGGAAVQGGGAIDGAAESITLSEVSLRGNRADGEAPGAALALHAGSATLSHCRVVDNRGRSGAAIYLSGSALLILVGLQLSFWWLITTYPYEARWDWR